MYSSEIMDLKNINKGDFKDLPFTSEVESSRADIPATYEDTVRHNAFIGEMPLDVIMEGIENQFDDYIGTEDKNNYVDIFYESLHASYKAANDGTETFQKEIIDVLNQIQDNFIAKIAELFNIRLTIKIADLESEDYDQDEIELIIRKLYEFFILNARNNFKIVIANDMKTRMTPTENHREYMKMVKTLLQSYSPLITTFGPMEFLKYRADWEIVQLFDDGKVIGNFLRKYSPKLYQYEEFEVDLVNYITMLQQIKDELYNECSKLID